MLIGRRTAAQLADIQSFGVHLSMCFTVRKERAHIPRRNVPEFFSPAVRGCSWPCARTDTWFCGQTMLVLRHGGGRVPNPPPPPLPLCSLDPHDQKFKLSLKCLFFLILKNHLFILLTLATSLLQVEMVDDSTMQQRICHNFLECLEAMTVTLTNIHEAVQARLQGGCSS